MPDSHPAVPFSKVLSDELDEIHESRAKREADQRAGLFGLAFSGGGIRSATFNLGVLQGLAGRELLAQIDYLSTVSGGGYIGSWFISLLKKNGTDAQVQQVQKSLSPARACHPEAEDQEAIEFLRQYSNYLTPRFAFYSADVWTMVATWFRNFFLNVLLLISCIGAVIILPRLIGLLFVSSYGPALAPAGAFDRPDTIVACIFFLFAALALCLNLRGAWKCAQPGVQFAIVIPLLAGAVFLAHWLRFFSESLPQLSFWSAIWPVWLFFAAAFLCIVWSTGFWACFREEHPKNRFIGWHRASWAQCRATAESLCQFVWTRAGAIMLLGLCSALPGFVIALMLYGVGSAIDGWHSAQVPWCLLAWGPPGLVMLLSIGMIIQIGLLGLEFNTSEREWLSRLRGWTLIYSAGWAIVFGGSLYGALWIVQLLAWHPWTAMGLSLGWIATTIAGVLSGNSSATSGKPGAPATGTGGGNPILEWIARIAPFIFMIGFVLAIAFAIHLVLSVGVLHPQGSMGWSAQMRTDYFSSLSSAADRLFGSNANRVFISGGLNLLFILVAAAVLLSLRLDINVFSLHEFYKNRLVRCYLGAVRSSQRKPDPFTGFDKEDDQILKNFTARKGGRYYGPYPIINTTMNVTTGAKLAWQERKSVPFIFTPLYSGYNPEQGNEAMRVGESPSAVKQRRGEASAYAYRPTEAFCYPKGVHLGTAMAVSGAATSPNQGYHTSTPVAFLMTVFDVRLGWWVGNPRRDDTYRHSSPRFNLATLSKELFGLTDARSGYVNLSDGGHFDNMGLYELVRRRCRYIIVSDAEQDGDLTFASLTTTIRNCRTDFGVEIQIALERIQRRDVYSSAHCVVGTINYPKDPANPDAPNDPGILLYLKSSLTGDEAADVLGYHTAHPEFPHQSTADQWFTEGQFEAYRKLGQHIAESAVSSVRSPAADRDAFFRELQSLWYPPSERVEKFAAKHASRFTDLTLALAGEDRLDFLDPQIFTSWEAHGERPDRWNRNAIYRAGALIEFMETVYSDLNLESKLQRDHPHNTGWLKIFEHWVAQPVFEETWRKTHDMYGRRFQEFYNDLVRQAQERKKEPV